MKYVNIVSPFLPYLVAIISSVISYFKSKHEFRVEIKKIEVNNQHEIDKLMEQHKVDIENLIEKHKLEMEAKDKDHEHEKEILELKSKNQINEHSQEVINNAIAGELGGILNNLLFGKIKVEDLEELSKKFPSKK